MLSISQDLEEENDDFTLHESEDNILLEDTPDEMEEKVDIGLEDEEDEVIIINEEDEVGQAIEESNRDQKVKSKDIEDDEVHKEIKKTTIGDALHVNVEDKTDEETYIKSSDGYCNSDGTNCEEKRGENKYHVDLTNPDPAKNTDIHAEETSKKKSKQTSEKNSKKDLASSEELEEELRGTYKSTQKKPKIKTSNLVNLEGCHKLLDQAQVRITSTSCCCFLVKALF